MLEVVKAAWRWMEKCVVINLAIIKGQAGLAAKLVMYFVQGRASNFKGS